jgi:hypothetical protein
MFYFTDWTSHDSTIILVFSKHKDTNCNSNWTTSSSSAYSRCNVCFYNRGQWLYQQLSFPVSTGAQQYTIPQYQDLLILTLGLCAAVHYQWQSIDKLMKNMNWFQCGNEVPFWMKILNDVACKLNWIWIEMKFYSVEFNWKEM